MQVLRVNIYQVAGIQIGQVKVAGGILVHIFMSDHDYGARSAECCQWLGDQNVRMTELQNGEF